MSGPLPAALVPLTAPLAWLYGRAVAARNRRFDDGVGVERVDVPVISVGNITAGGSGKTPHVAWLVERLRERGRRPAVCLRGYKAPPGGESDEAREYAERLPGVPVAVGADRVATLRAFLPRHDDVDCVVLDDGFQHRRLHRDVDIVLVEADGGVLDGRLLPRGFLREPPSSLCRADAVVVSRASAPGDPASVRLAERVAEHHGAPPVAWTRHGWHGVLLRRGGAAADERVDPAWLKGRRVVTLLGVGRPETVIAQLGGAGATVVADIAARDHEHFSASKLERARAAAAGERADAVVMTAKDWARVGDRLDLTAWPVPIAVPELAIEVIAGEAPLLDLVLRAMAEWLPPNV